MLHIYSDHKYDITDTELIISDWRTDTRTNKQNTIYFVALLLRNNLNFLHMYINKNTYSISGKEIYTRNWKMLASNFKLFKMWRENSENFNDKDNIFLN